LYFDRAFLPGLGSLKSQKQQDPTRKICELTNRNELGNLNLARKVNQHNLYILIHTYIQSAVQNCKKEKRNMTTEEIKPINTTVFGLDLKMAIGMAIMFAVGLCAGAYLALSGFFA
jgi:hypothetical protein